MRSNRKTKHLRTPSSAGSEQAPVVFCAGRGGDRRGRAPIMHIHSFWPPPEADPFRPFPPACAALTHQAPQPPPARTARKAQRARTIADVRIKFNLLSLQTVPKYLRTTPIRAPAMRPCPRRRPSVVTEGYIRARPLPPTLVTKTGGPPVH